MQAVRRRFTNSCILCCRRALQSTITVSYCKVSNYTQTLPLSELINNSCLLSSSHAVQNSRLLAVSLVGSRHFCLGKELTDVDVKNKVGDIADKFKEAMELLEDARGSMGTVYFTEDMTDADNAITEVLSDYHAFLQQLNEEQRRNVLRTIGLKMEELKAQVEMVKESLKE